MTVRPRRPSRHRLPALCAALVLVTGGLLGGTTVAHAETTEHDLAAAFATGGAVTLDNDLTTGPLVLDPGVSLDLDLGGHTLTVTGTGGSAGHDGSAGLRVSGHLIVRNGQLTTRGGPGAAGADGAAGTAAAPDGRPGVDGTGGGAGLVVDAGAVLAMDRADLNSWGGPGGMGGAGGAGHDGANATDPGASGGPGGAGGAGGNGGITGSGIVNDGILALSNNAALLAGSDVGGGGGAGGAGGHGGAGAPELDGAGGAGGAGGVGGAAGGQRLNVDNNGVLLSLGGDIMVFADRGSGGAGGAGGAGGPGGGAGPDGPAGVDGSIGSYDAPFSSGMGGDNWEQLTLIGNGSDRPSTMYGYGATIGDVLSALDELVTPWPVRANHRFDGWWWSAGPDAIAVPPTDTVDWQTIYAHWVETCSPTILAAELAGAADGDTITLCGDVTVTPDDPALAVPAGVSLTLDLNGYTLTTAGAASVPGVAVGETSALTITDTSPDGTGTLRATGGDQAAGIGSAWPVNSGTITIDAGTVEATGGCSGAGIGGGWGTMAGPITIDGGTITATAGHDTASCTGAGLGGGYQGGAQAITINGGHVTAVGAADGAGIGTAGAYGGDRAGARTFTMTGGVVEATGGPSYLSIAGGAGVGAGGSRTFVSIDISGGELTATGGRDAAGLGGGGYGTVETVTISGGTVTAHGSGGGAGIGAGRAFGGADVTIGVGAVVAVSAEAGSNAIGDGDGANDFGSLSNAGELTILAGSVLTIPDGVTMINSGTVITAPGAAGAANGAVVNNGIIVNTGTIVTPDDVSVHNYVVSFDPNGGELGAGSDLGAVRVYGPVAVGLSAPADVTRDGFVLAGWNSAADGTGVDLVDEPDLTFAGDGPATITWFAQWVPELVVTTDALPDGQAGEGYAAQLSASGGLADEQVWELAAGDLPPGLVLNPDGSVTGTPTHAGTYRFTVAVNEAAYAELSITIAPADVPPRPAPPAPEAPVDEPPLAGTGSPAGASIVVALLLVTAGLTLLRRARRR